MHCLALSAFLLASVSGPLTSARKEPMVTYFMFSQQWSTGYCSTAHSKCIKENERNFWTIHGLWPSSDNPTPPEFCNRTLRYNATALEPLVPQLDQYWASLTSTNNNIFWKHEWQKHGTCATVVPALDGLVNFFNTTLHMYLKYNFTEYLQNSGVLPSSQSTYKLEDIKEALHDDVKGAANFVCYSSKNYSAPVLAEIRICLSRELRPIDCKPKHSGCGQGEVYYLPFGTDDAVLQTSPFSWLLHCAWLFAISVMPMPVRRLL